MIFIDTTTLAPSQNKCCNEYGGISKDVQKERISSQMKIIETYLACATLTGQPSWIIVNGKSSYYTTRRLLKILTELYLTHLQVTIQFIQRKLVSYIYIFFHT